MAVRFSVQFSQQKMRFSTQFCESGRSFSASFGEVINTGHFPLYEGRYEVTPKVAAQVLPTASRSMAQDVTVKAIPYYEVDNAYQGQTVIIGGN